MPVTQPSEISFVADSTNTSCRLNHATVYINYDGYAAGVLLLMNASGEKFSAKNPEDMLKLGSVASMGLPKYLLR